MTQAAPAPMPPMPPMHQVAELRGTRTALEVSGSGPALLMLHGAEGSRRQFAAVRGLLADRYTVVTYDQRDCGDTTNLDTPATLEMLADDALAVLQHLGLATAHVFGASFGGRVAQVLALRHAAAVQRLVLASTWPLAVSLAQANPDVAQALARLRMGLPDTAEQMAEIFYPADYLAAHPAARGHFKGAGPRSARSDRRAAAVADLPGLDVAGIAAPTLLIAGDADRVVPSAVTLSLAGLLADCRSVLLPGVGHLTLAQAPQAVAQHVRGFLG